jgi:hypothetical protein
MQQVTNRHFCMDAKLFDTWTDQLIDKAYDYRQIGISNEYCNQISEPEYGIQIIDWSDKSFEVVDDHKYLVFLLKNR